MFSRVIARLPSPVGRALDINGHVFTTVTAAGMAVLLVIASRHQQTAVVAVLGLGLATIIISRLWSTVVLRSVSAGRVLDRHALFPGEELQLQLHVANNKLLPMPWVEVAQDLPAGLRSDHQGGPKPTGQRRLARSFSLPWYSRITWNERLVAQRRGLYHLPAMEISSGDILGLYPRATAGGPVEQLTVYPRLYPVHHLSTQRTDASGELVGVSTLHEDPTRVRGIREYAPGDSLRRVHWKATARQRSLMVKLFEPSAVSRVELALVADAFCEASANDFELAVSSVASVARFCVEHQQQVALSSNARLGHTDTPFHLGAGGGDHHLLSILEVLARIECAVARPFPAFLHELRRLALARTALIVVTGRMEPTCSHAFQQLYSMNASFRVLVVDPTGHRSRVSFPCTFVRSPDDLLAIGRRAR